MPFYRWALHGRPIPLSQTHHPGLECGRKESRGLSEGGIVWRPFVLPRFYKRSLVLRYKCVRAHEQQVPFTKQRFHPHFLENQTPQGFLLHHSAGGSHGQWEGEAAVTCLWLFTVPAPFPEMDSYSRLQNTHCMLDLESSTT